MLFRTLILLGGVAALSACGQMTGAKTETPATADSSATATTADATGAKPAEGGGEVGNGAKPAEPSQAPAGAAPDKP